VQALTMSGVDLTSAPPAAACAAMCLADRRHWRLAVKARRAENEHGGELRLPLCCDGHELPAG